MRIGGSGYFSGVNEEALLEDLFAHSDKTLGEPYRDASGDPDHVYPHTLWPDLCGFMAIACLAGLEPLPATRISPRETYRDGK
jgi:hypothetical protein